MCISGEEKRIAALLGFTFHFWGILLNAHKHSQIRMIFKWGIITELVLSVILLHVFIYIFRHIYVLIHIYLKSENERKIQVENAGSKWSVLYSWIGLDNIFETTLDCLTEQKSPWNWKWVALKCSFFPISLSFFGNLLCSTVVNTRCTWSSCASVLSYLTELGSKITNFLKV